VCYGFVSQTLLIEPEFREWDELKRDIMQTLIHNKNVPFIS
jgi:hypothetical protein